MWQVVIRESIELPEWAFAPFTKVQTLGTLCLCGTAILYAGLSMRLLVVSQKSLFI